jgi:iron complex outermembrane receptor protein
MHRSSDAAAVRLAVTVICAASSGAAFAQQQSAAQKTVEEVTVTGSYLARPADRPAPVAVMDHQQIQADQRITLTEAVRDLPQISSANTTNNWLTPTNSISLRGLGPRSTLVLLNGQRMTIDANAGSQVDINNLAPSIMVQRVELLLDGASALYGSDAVAGVANFITRDNFDGLDVNLSTQIAQTQTDAPEIVAGAIYGTQRDDSGLVLSAEIQHRGKKLQEEDRWGPDRLSHGLQTALWNPGTFFGATTPGWYKDPLCGSALIGGTGDTSQITNPAGYFGGPFCRGDLSLQRTSVPKQDQITGMAVYHKNFAPGGLEGFKFEANFARADAQSSYGTGVPLLALPSVSGTIPVLPATNPGVIDAHQRDPNFPLQDYKTVFSRQFSPLDGDAATPDSYSRQNTYRMAATFNGRFGSNFDFRLTGTFSENDQEVDSLDTIIDRYMRALQGYGGPACKWNFVQGAGTDPNVQPGVGNCQYWNPFASRLLAQPGDPTYNSPELADWMTYGGTTLGRAKFTSVEWVTTGHLWNMSGGPTGIALGAQYRNQDLQIRVDPISKDGGFGFTPQILKDWGSQRDTKATFAELDMYPSKTFELDLAARYEQTLGQASTEPKVSLLWTPTDKLFFRATAGTSFRLASENQLYGIGPGSVARGTIGGEVTQATGIAVGNPKLKPETSDNWTLGFTFDITDNVSFDLTYWNYKFKNQVTSTDAQAELDADIADGWVNAGPNDSNPIPNSQSSHPLFPGRPNEVCEVTGRWDPNSGQPLPAGCVTGFDFQIFKTSWINRDITETDGLDFTFDWHKALSGGGEFGTRFVGSYVLKYSGTTINGTLVDVVGTDGYNVEGVGTNPQLRANLINTYNKGNNSFRASWHFISGTKLTNPNPLLAAWDPGDYYQLDLTYAHKFNSKRPTSLTFALINATDAAPPLRPNGLITYDASLYDGRGRMFRMSYDFGF